MLSHSISLGNNQSELQFIGDLINLCNRHKVSCGKPQDLEHLGADLIFNDAFRSDLFALCMAISHFAEVPAPPEQLLVLVARALGGPGLSLVDTATDIPHDARSVFLTGFETWLQREPDPEAGLPQRTDSDPPPRPTLYYAAASRFGSDHSETHEDPPVSHSTADEPLRTSAPQSPPPDGLTSNELRMYFEDIERRMRQIELEQFAIRAESSAEGSERLEDFDGQSVHQAKITLGSPNSARVQRLRTVIAVLALLLIAACASAAIFAYRSLKLQPLSVATSPSTPLQSSAASSGTSAIPMLAHDSAGRADTHTHQPSLHPAAAKFESPSNKSAASLTPRDSIRPSVTAPTASGPVETPPPAPIADPDKRPENPLAVPANTMMSYAVSKPDPIYPPTRHFGVDSTVAVKTTISKEGEVTNAEALTGTPAVRAAALQAVQAWHFKPYLLNGSPVAVVTTFKFFFGGQ